MDRFPISVASNTLLSILFKSITCRSIKTVNKPLRKRVPPSSKLMAAKVKAYWNTLNTILGGRSVILDANKALTMSKLLSIHGDHCQAFAQQRASLVCYPYSLLIYTTLPVSSLCIVEYAHGKEFY